MYSNEDVSYHVTSSDRCRDERQPADAVPVRVILQRAPRNNQSHDRDNPHTEIKCMAVLQNGRAARSIDGTSLSDAGHPTLVAFGCVTQGCYVSLRQSTQRKPERNPRKMPATSDRWKAAQQYEQGYWRSVAAKIRKGATGQLNWYRTRAERLVQRLARLGFAHVTTGNARVLEVGSGPIGLVTFFPGANVYPWIRSRFLQR